MLTLGISNTLRLAYAVAHRQLNMGALPTFMALQAIRVYY